MADHSQMKLGKLAPLRRPSLFQMAKFVDRAKLEPQILTTADYTPKVMATGGYPMLLNSNIGDCVEASGLHVVQTWVENAGGSFVPTDPMASMAYTAVTGYNPNAIDADGSNPTDQGTNEESFLDYWKNSGVGHLDATVAHTLYAYMAFNIEDQDELLFHTKFSVALFGVAFLGLALPVSAQSQDIWGEGPVNGDDSPGSWGGHCVPIFGYDDPKQQFLIVTWGGLKWMTYGFYQKYCDEGYGLLSADWANPDTQANAPSGFAFKDLQTDLADVAA